METTSRKDKPSNWKLDLKSMADFVKRRKTNPRTQEPEPSTLSRWPTMHLTLENELAEESEKEKRPLRRHQTHQNLKDVINSDNGVNTDKQSVTSDDDMNDENDGMINEGDIVHEASISGGDSIYFCALETIEEESELYITADETFLLSHLNNLDSTKGSNTRTSGVLDNTPGLNKRRSNSLIETLIQDDSMNEESSRKSGSNVHADSERSSKGHVLKYSLRDQTIVSIEDITTTSDSPVSVTGVDTEQEQGSISGSNLTAMASPITSNFDIFKYVIGDCGDVKPIFPRNPAHVHVLPEVPRRLDACARRYGAYPLQEVFEARQTKRRKLRIGDIVCGCSGRRSKDKQKTWEML